MALIEVSSSITQVIPSEYFSDGFELSNQSIIPSQDYSGSFTPNLNNIEFYVYNAQKAVQYSDYNFTNYKITANSTPNATPSGVQLTDAQIESTTNTIDLNPEQDTYNVGFTNGTLTAVYNFVNNELSSSIDNPYYLSEISGDRTEIRLKSNYISNNEIKSAYIAFEQTLVEAEYFDEFYISFGNNESHIGINSQLVGGTVGADNEQADGQNSILIKLYDALPGKHAVGDTLYVYTKTGETQAFQIDFEETINIPDNSIRIKGPNTNLNIKDFVNNSSTYKNKSELLGTKSSASKDELLNVLDQKGVHLTPNYSTSSFEEFVNFSSAKSRVNNFYTKVKNIQTYENEIRLISATTSSNSTSVSSSIAGLFTKIEQEIVNFDGYEYYLYYNTSSNAYPKTGSVYPYELLPYTDAKVLRWLGSDVENNQYYGGTLFSASRYDNDNENWLYYTIPTFISENNNNDNYIEFSNMVGQSFDELWLYTKAVTEKLNTTNQLDKGVPLSLADDVITSLGYTGFGNNYNNQDNFIGLIGNDNGDYLPPTGSELITNYISVNNGTITNYWEEGYSFDDYVKAQLTDGFPYPIDKVSKEIFKRLYHNMAYLVKKKGTIAGLRQLINIWGIPSTILRINEFGGKNKDETDDYDLWYNRFSYAFTGVGNSYQASASAVFPWMPLQRNYIAENQYIVPDGVGFRFKTTGYPSSSFAGNFDSQSLAVKKSNNTNDNEFDWGIALFYTGSTSGSYSGSSNSDYVDYGEMKFFISGAAADGGVAISDPIYLPFFDKGWWTVLLQRDAHSNLNSDKVTYTLYAKNKLYDGWDGNSIGFEGSASITNFDPTGAGIYGTGNYGTALYGGYISSSLNYAWNNYGVGEFDGVYIGGRIQGSKVYDFITNTAGHAFSGSFQEFRYYSNEISESVFNDTVMNPESIEGNRITGSESSFDIVNFRAPLGNELESFFTASSTVGYKETFTSVHPAITASAPEYITGSFINDADNSITSSYYVQYESNPVKRTYSKPNTETYFLDQPAIGIRNRITNKIQSTSNLNFGTALSNVVSIQKDPFISQSYTENINQLEVAFSPQDEINDDIIQSLGYGAIQSAIADPRFRSSSADSYPQLRKIADDYFKKYVGSDVFAYLRLIKYFDDSLFKAIKNYVPARTSVSTGVVIKQNMLERNRYREPQINSFTTQSYAINNIPLPLQNLELTSSIDVYNFSGSAGGSVNEYNSLSTQTGSMGFFSNIPSAIPAGGYLNIMPNVITSNAYDDLFIENNNDFGIYTSGLKSKKPISAQFSIHADGPLTSVALIISSSLRGELFKLDKVWVGSGNTSSITPLIDIDPKETLNLYAYNSNNNIGAVTITNFVWKTYNPVTGPDELESLITYPSISSSTSPNTQSFIDNNSTKYGIVSTIENFQEEFYDGEYSGSNLNTIITQTNPYKNIPPSSVALYTQPVVNANLAGDSSGLFIINNDNAFDCNNTTSGTVFLTRLTDISLYEYQKYQISYDLVVLNNPNSTTAGVSTDIQINPDDPSSGFWKDTNSGLGVGEFANNGSNDIHASSATIRRSIFTFIPPKFNQGDSSYPYALVFEVGEGMEINVNNFEIKGIGGIYGDVVAQIPWDLNVVNNYNPLTSGSFDIANTQSIMFDTSDYNPLNNNASQNRKSTTHYQLSYNSSTTPENINNIIAVMYEQSSSDFAILTDSNYTAFSALNPTYRGTKIKSLNYNEFTPSGSVKPILSLPPQPVNSKRAGVSSSVANNFLDGSTGSWAGDDVNSRISAVIDKHPQYIAHFARSFDQFNVYNSREFTVDSLISISMENLGGQEITPISIDIDGSNAHKKWVSSVFEPDRKSAVSYTPQNSTAAGLLNLETLPVGNYDILGGSVQFLTLNSNAKNKNVTSDAYFYNRGDTSLSQIAFTGSIYGEVLASQIIESGSNYTQGTLEIFQQSTDGDGQSGGLFPRFNTSGVCTSILISASAFANGALPYEVLSWNYKPGDTVTINAATLQNIGGYGGGTGNVVFTLSERNVTAPSSITVKQETGITQMVTASNVTSVGQSYGFLLSGSSTTGSEGNFLLPFAEDVPEEGFVGLEDSAKLSIGGPQLALFHSYNQLVAQESTRGALECPLSNVSFSRAWVLEGIDPAAPENYYQWSPSASDCPAYEDNQLPYLIERGDVLRVEGIKSIASKTTSNLTSSIKFTEDFTVEDVENFYYSSSAFAPSPGQCIIGTSPLSSNVQNPTVVLGNTGTGGPFTITPASATDPAGGSGMSFSVQAFAGKQNNSFSLSAASYTVNGTGNSYSVGMEITITSAEIGAAFGVIAPFGDVVITLDSSMVQTGGFANPWIGKLELNPGCGGGQQGPYQTYDQGAIAFNLPTFIKTDRNPSEVLLGLTGGAVSKFTIVRRIENERKVLLKNIPTSIGSKGFLQQTGGGYLIPKDLSEIQKENALNIINQLRQKNAFPGDTATDSNTSSS